MISHLALSLALLTALFSMIAFVAIGIDKRRARLGRWRISHRTLHLLELLGGWPGSLIARRLWRHKTIDRRYRLIAGIIIVLHLVAWASLAWHALAQATL